MQIDAGFWELYDQFSSETDINGYIGFDIEVFTSLTAVGPLIVGWRQETRNESIAEVIEMSDTANEEANQSEKEPEIVIDEAENIER